MVIGLLWFPVFNQMLADQDGGGRTTVKRGVEGATSIREAVERANLFESMGEEMAIEARAVMAAFSPEIDRQILTAMSDGFERDVPITFEWKRHTEISVEVTPGDAPGEVHIILRTPPGEDFL